MGESKRHHFVPRVYLKNFASKKFNTYFINVCDKSRSEPFTASIRDIAMEKNYNTVNRLEDKLYWEKYYSDGIELIMEKQFKKLLLNCNCCFANDGFSVLSAQDKLEFSKIIVIQLLRTKKSRNFQMEIAEDVFPGIVSNFKQQIKNININNEILEKVENLTLTDDLFKECTLSGINDPERINRISDIIANKTWIFYKNNNYKFNPFVTSDNPVMDFNILNKDVEKIYNGFANITTVIHYPISPSILLAIYDKNLFYSYLQAFDCTIKILSTEKDLEFIQKCNNMQYKQCFRQVYFPLFESQQATKNI